MTVNFQPDICLPHDPAGFGQWLSGHAYEHEVLRQRCLKLNPPVQLPDYDVRSWRDDPPIVKMWLETHEIIHEAIRSALNVTGIDFSEVDLSDDGEWYSWMDDHATEHLLFRQILRIT